MENEWQRAKELFTEYLGSSFQMHREGEYEEYKTYNVPKELEVIWFNELIDQFSKELSIIELECKQ